MKALILNGKVVDLAEEPFEVHESLTWVDAVEGVVYGWAYENGVFSAPVVPEITHPAPTKEQLMAELQALAAKIQAME